MTLLGGNIPFFVGSFHRRSILKIKQKQKGLPFREIVCLDVRIILE